MAFQIPKNDSKDMNQSEFKASENSLSFAKGITEIKERRKLMESNAQMLLNRLQALSQEEYKLKKSAFDIKKRSQELLNHRLQREKQKTTDEKQNQQREKVQVNEVDQLRKTVEQARTKAQNNAAKIQDLILQQRRKEAQAIREQRLLNEEKIGQAKQQHVEKQKVKSLKVKQEEEMALEKIKEYYKVKEELMKEERDKHIRDEEERILEKEVEIQRLVEEEERRLDQLNRAEDDETQAKTEYDDISKLPTESLAEKYSSFLRQSYTPKIKASNGFSGNNLKSMLSATGKSMTQPNDIGPLHLRSYDALRKSQVAL